MLAIPKLSVPSRFKRVQQWQLFMRYWHVIDANFQDIYALSNKIALYLCGRKKPIWHPETDCGDHVVVINTSFVAMHGFDWKHTLFHFNRRYPRSKRDLEAFRIQEYDPCRVLWMTTYQALSSFYTNGVPKRKNLQRLHLFPENSVPLLIKRNIGNQLKQIQKVPRKSIDYSDKERKQFPNLKKFSNNHILDWHASIEPKYAFDGALEEQKIIENM